MHWHFLPVSKIAFDNQRFWSPWVHLTKFRLIKLAEYPEGSKDTLIKKPQWEEAHVKNSTKTHPKPLSLMVMLLSKLNYLKRARCFLI